MKLELKRTIYTEKSTIGLLYVDGEYECMTLEDVVRPDGEKVFGKTAIPYGRYSVIINDSAHFKRKLPLLLNVPNFEGVRIHSGNRPEDTEGCILVGLRAPKDRPDWIEMSHAAFDGLFLKMLNAESPITIEITDGRDETKEVPA